MKLPRDVPITDGRDFIDLNPEISATILRTIKAGWAIASQWPDVNTDAYEVVMTERLRDGMRSALRGTPWSKNMIVLPGTESRSRQEVPLPDGRTDISILLSELRVHGRREVVMIKPNARRHWMGVSALEDADAVIVESFSGSAA